MSSKPLAKSCEQCMWVNAKCPAAAPSIYGLCPCGFRWSISGKDVSGSSAHVCPFTVARAWGGWESWDVLHHSQPDHCCTQETVLAYGLSKYSWCRLFHMSLVSWMALNTFGCCSIISLPIDQQNALLRLLILEYGFKSENEGASISCPHQLASVLLTSRGYRMCTLRKRTLCWCSGNYLALICHHIVEAPGMSSYSNDAQLPFTLTPANICFKIMSPSYQTTECVCVSQLLFVKIAPCVIHAVVVV